MKIAAIILMYPFIFILYIFLIILQFRTARIIIDITNLHQHKSLHKKIFDQFIANNISLPTTAPPIPSTTTGSYESGLISCFGTKEKEEEEMDPMVRTANTQLPSLCNVSFSDMGMETKIYCYALIVLWAMLMFSSLIYQVKTFTMLKQKNKKPKGGGGDMLKEMEEAHMQLKDFRIG
jgi:hypothetical protein